MMGNMETEWAVKVVLLLAIRKEALSLKELSAGTKIPLTMLKHIIQDLEQSGILITVADGRQRYELRSEATNITLDDILDSLENQIR